MIVIRFPQEYIHDHRPRIPMLALPPDCSVETIEWFKPLTTPRRKLQAPAYSISKEIQHAIPQTQD